MAAPPPPPPPQFLPAFAWWCFARQLKQREIAEALGCSIETARRYQLPFGAAMRRTPEPPMMDRIVAWTQGEVQPGSFYPSAEVLAAIRQREAA